MKKQKSTLATVVANSETLPGSGINRLILRSDDFRVYAPGPGQFVALETMNANDKMRRPITIATHHDDLMTLYIQATGRPDSNTRQYCRLSPGATLNVSPARGRIFNADLFDQNILLIAGGIGAPALISFAKHYKARSKNIKLILGARRAAQLCCQEEFEALNVPINMVVDEETPGLPKGQATDLLDECLANNCKNVTIIACGPKLMLEAVHNLCVSYGVKCYVVLEEIMACSGAGSCYGCVVAGGNDMNKPLYKQICVDGPTFDSRWIHWKPFLRQNRKTFRQTANSTNPFRTVLKSPNGLELKLTYPWMAASGTLGLKDALTSDALTKVGAIVTKGYKLDATTGNPMPRTAETECGGLLNSIGLQNEAVATFIRERLPELLLIGLPVIVNIWGHSIEECATVAALLDNTGIAAIELNISCPNVKKGGILFGTDPLFTTQVVKAVRQSTGKFLIVKLTPNVSDIVVIAQAAKAGGADCLSIGNTLKGAAIDIYTRRPKLATIHGGYSGTPIKPVMISKIIEVHMSGLGLPIIGIGGIRNGNDIIEYGLAGASACMVGTEWMAREDVFERAVHEVAGHLARFKVGRFSDIIGTFVH